MEEIVVEIADAAGSIRERHRITSFPFSIGRGYDNDIVVLDEYVSPKHLSLQRDAEGRIHIADERSLNGTFVTAQKQRVTSREVVHDLVIGIGQTSLRFIDPRVPVAEAKRLEARRTAFGSTYFTAAILFMTVVGMAAILEYLTGYNRYKPNLGLQLAIETTARCIATWLPWTFLWTIIGGIIVRKNTFPRHISIVSLFVFAGFLVFGFIRYLQFAFNIPQAGDVMWYVSAFILGTGLLYYHVLVATEKSKRFALLFSTGILTTIASLGLAYYYATSSNFKSYITSEEHLQPPILLMTTGSSLDSFIASTKILQGQLDEERAAAAARRSDWKAKLIRPNTPQ